MYIFTDVCIWSGPRISHSYLLIDFYPLSPSRISFPLSNHLLDIRMFPLSACSQTAWSTSCCRQPIKIPHNQNFEGFIVIRLSWKSENHKKLKFRKWVKLISSKIIFTTFTDFHFLNVHLKDKPHMRQNECLKKLSIAHSINAKKTILVLS